MCMRTAPAARRTRNVLLAIADFHPNTLFPCFNLARESGRMGSKEERMQGNGVPPDQNQAQASVAYPWCGMGGETGQLGP
jgi:hypothetical protein